MDAVRPAAAALLGLTLLACDADPNPGQGDAAPPPADAAVVDEVLLVVGERRLTVSPEGTRLALRGPEGPLLTEISAEITLAGRTLGLDDWPSRGWTISGGRAVGRFPAGDGLPDLTWVVALEPHGLESALTVEGAGPTIPLEATTPLVATLDDWLGADGSARPVDGAGWAPPPIAPRPDSQWLRGPLGTIGVRADGPVTVALAPTLTVTDRRPALPLGRGGVVQTATVTVAFPEADPPPLSAPGGPAGWRSGAWGSAINRSLVLQQAEALSRRGHSAASLMLDGLWYAGPGDARGGLSFPGGIEALASQIEPLRLLAAWPLHAAPDAPVVLDHPAAALDETERCGRPACVRLDPRVPAVRADAARTLLGTALAAVWLVDLPDAAQVGGGALETLAAELQDAGLSVTLASAAPWPLSDPCRAAASDHPWPAGCAAHLVEAHLTPPEAAPALDPLGWRALDAAGNAFDPGPVRLDRSADGAARLAVALAWIAGGPRLLGDDLATLPEARWPLAAALWRSAVGPARPVTFPADSPPTQWRSAEVYLWTQWGDEAREITAPSGGPWRDLLRPDDPEWPSGTRLTVPPRDALALAPASRFTGARGKE